MIDLHLHTHYSDGTMSPEELVKYAQQNNISTIAITDHDGMGGLKEGAEAGRRLGVRVIPGIELSTEDDEGIYAHILGYFFDPENEDLKNEIEWIRQKRVERNKKMLAALNRIGCKLNWDDLQLREGQDFIGKPTFALALMRKGYISTPEEAFKEGRFMRSETVRSVHREKITAKRAIELIRGAGGAAVLAHPMKIGRLGKEANDAYFEKLDLLLAKLKDVGLGGMECYYSEHRWPQTEHLIQLVKKHGLLVTAGSDFHGIEFNRVHIGGFETDRDYNEEKIIGDLERYGLYSSQI